MIDILAVLIGGFIGAVARFGISSYLSRKIITSFPWGILSVNLIGALVIGFVFPDNGDVSKTSELFLITGILGGFTTFSTFGMESIELLKKGSYLHLAIYIVVTVFGGMLLFSAGYLL
ncbi:fluoride efflux transporter CrcB [Peribacillus psychrosaccharolyticus]|uniref:fluoride efflux transporter CrcB n=1 Tax=Peribacillus psychrosaccharolyticus TaxID=1407 RepID=UPI003D2DC430